MVKHPQPIPTAMEAELGTLFINSKLATQLHYTLAKLGHPQPPTLIQTGNLTAYGVVMNKIIQWATKAMDMHFHWLCDPKQQQQFRFNWQLGNTNSANYWTRHHTAAHHKLMHQVFLTVSTTSSIQNDCSRSASSAGHCNNIHH